MKTITFTEFRKHATEFLDEVEKGEVVRILRRGKAIADLSPVLEKVQPSWRNPKFALSGVSLSNAILQHRKVAEK